MGTDVLKWADAAMYEAPPMPDPGKIKVTLVNATPMPVRTVASVCRIFEGKAHLQPVEIEAEEAKGRFTEMHKTALQAPLEFVSFHFIIEGVTRAFTHQIVRQRTAVYAQESLRFAVKTSLKDEAALPPSIACLPENDDRRRRFEQALAHIDQAYKYLVGNDIPAEDARALQPHATTTRLHYHTNLRNLLNHAGLRLCTQAQFEWRDVFIKLVQAIDVYGTGDPIGPSQGSRDDEWEFEWIARSGAFAPICFRDRKCQFASDMDRGCTIRKRVDAGLFNEILPEEYMSDPRAGWTPHE